MQMFVRVSFPAYYNSWEFSFVFSNNPERTLAPLRKYSTLDILSLGQIILRLCSLSRLTQCDYINIFVFTLHFLY